MSVSRDDPRPPYMQVADLLRRAIDAGEYRPGQRLPSGRALAQQYEVAANTVQRAVELLKAEGLLVSYPTRGMFVRSTAEEPEFAGQDQPEPSREYLEIKTQLDELQHVFREQTNVLDQRLTVLEERVLQQQRRSTAERAPETAKPEPQPVVAAIVTSELGVLVGKRRDGKPPWTFIAGEIEPGESAADAAIREVKEEAGLLVDAFEREIGRRVHPQTGRTMIYLACHPVRKTDVFVGDEDELLEVRWVSLSEADALLPNMFAPVRDYLASKLEHTGTDAYPS